MTFPYLDKSLVAGQIGGNGSSSPLINQKSGGAQTYLVFRGENSIYSLAVDSVDYDVSPARVTKGQEHHPIPVMLSARLAIDRDEQGKGLGRAFLKDALLRTLQAADIAGIRTLLVHAKDDEARTRYESFYFEPSPTDPYHLFLLMKNLRSLNKQMIVLMPPSSIQKYSKFRIITHDYEEAVEIEVIYLRLGSVFMHKA